jgi:thymidylate synthase
MNNLDKQYQSLLQDILDNGVSKKDRTGTGTISVFGRQIRHKMSEGFPLLTTKKMYFKGVITELLWFLNGDTNIKYLLDNDCHIWDGDAYKNYTKKVQQSIETATKDGILKQSDEDIEINFLTKESFIHRIKTDDDFAKQWGNLGPVYGKQWRDWFHGTWWMNGSRPVTIEKHIDQIKNSIELLKSDPDSRRNRVNAWNVGDIDSMVLPPCHTDFQFYTRELSEQERVTLLVKKIGSFTTNSFQDECDKNNIPTRAISLMWNQRSVDTFLGLPFNIASYGLLLEIFAKIVNMVPDELIGNLGDVHLYSNHIEQAKEQIGRDLTQEERYNLWFSNNYETGMERFFNPEELPDYDNSYYEPTPTRTREPYDLPKLVINKTESFWNNFDVSQFSHLDSNDFTIENYKSHPIIKAPLSN